MAKFDVEFDLVVKAEGTYGNDPVDSGGETYLGISRVHNPGWAGWPIIDKLKKVHGHSFKNYLKNNNELTNKAKALYKSQYWDCFELDDIPSQKIAHQLFDTCVNMGKVKAIRLLQETLGYKVNGRWTSSLKHKLMKL